MVYQPDVNILTSKQKDTPRTKQLTTSNQKHATYISRTDIDNWDDQIYAVVNIITQNTSNYIVEMNVQRELSWAFEGET